MTRCLHYLTKAYTYQQPVPIHVQINDVTITILFLDYRNQAVDNCDLVKLCNSVPLKRIN